MLGKHLSIYLSIYLSMVNLHSGIIMTGSIQAVCPGALEQKKAPHDRRNKIKGVSFCQAPQKYDKKGSTHSFYVESYRHCQKSTISTTIYGVTRFPPDSMVIYPE